MEGKIMRILKAENYEDMSKKAANIIAAQVTLKPECVLGLATGSTPIGTYDVLTEKYNQGELDFGGVSTVNLDEYKGLDRENDQSYYYFMHKLLFDRVNIDKSQMCIRDRPVTPVFILHFTEAWRNSILLMWHSCQRKTIFGFP